MFDYTNYLNLVTNHEYVDSGYKCKAIPLKPNTQYTVSFPTKEATTVILLINNVSHVNEAGFLDTRNTSDNKVFTTDITGNLYIGCVLSTDEAINNLLENLHLQIEQGSTATSYVEHQEQNLPFSLGDIELNKIDTAQDYFYKENNKWYIHKETGKEIYDGSIDENWAKGSTTDVDRFAINTNLYSNNINSKCNYFKKTSGITIDKGTWFNNNGLQVGFNFSDYGTTTLEQWKQWLSTHNIIVIQPLATPTNTEITETPLINQLEAIKQARSYDDQTNITQTNEDLPFILNIEALKS